MIFGYARVSTDDQNLSLQIDALTHYGIDKLFQEKVTGAVNVNIKMYINDCI
ncbi:TPA: recombinase family protein, partial [Staphylococcus aureus]|nr:recombinase family protein [Staphylococcus aureus]